MKKLNSMMRYACIALTLLLSAHSAHSQNHSVAHKWNEVNLQSIRNDFARPTIHARNLFHASILMYDCYAAYDSDLSPYFLGDSLGSYHCPFDGVSIPANVELAQKEAISFAMFRLLKHRYASSPNYSTQTEPIIDSLMSVLGYNGAFTLTDYSIGSPAALGNYIAQQLIAATLTHNGFTGDGSNEINGFANQVYTPVNSNIFMVDSGNPTITDMNRWQPISVTLFYDQACNPFPFTPPFLSPEWGEVVPFALHDSVMTIKNRDGADWKIFHDPLDPPYWTSDGSGSYDQYAEGFKTVVTWSSHLDPNDGVMMDISPASIGNLDVADYPTDPADYANFYDILQGGDPSTGRPLNPKTGMPYQAQVVPRGDYARVLAEFWADGPSSETPPGHWFSIYNQTSDHPEFVKKWEGIGPVLSDLEYDVRAYFTLGGALHDAAVTAWSIKGYYDYLRPVSAIRAMADLGQSSDPSLTNYHPGGMPLEPGFIEVVLPGDPLEGPGQEDLGKIKIMTWLGPVVDETANPCLEGDVYIPTTAGVGWKLAEDWWPFQRPSFVSPNFAGYVSGHSTFSRAAAEVLTFMTGDEYFPGGMGEFHCPQNDFLVFEEGPSVDLTLQWATYRDASDQTSLSRIWGGIHPPVDDIPGRLMGIEIGQNAFTLAQRHFDNRAPEVLDIIVSDTQINDDDAGNSLSITIQFDELMDIDFAPELSFSGNDPTAGALALTSANWISDSTYVFTYDIIDTNEDFSTVTCSISSSVDRAGNETVPFTSPLFILDTENPAVATVEIEQTGMPVDMFSFNIQFSEAMNTSNDPLLEFPVEDPLANSLSYASAQSFWVNDSLFVASYDLADAEEEISLIDFTVSGLMDMNGNDQVMYTEIDAFSIDTKNPSVTSITPSASVLTDMQVGPGMFSLALEFDEEMDQSLTPILSYSMDNPMTNSLTLDEASSFWLSSTIYTAVFDLADANEHVLDIDIALSQARDVAGNDLSPTSSDNVFVIDTKNPSISTTTTTNLVLTDALTGNGTFSISFIFDEDMDVTSNPVISFPVEDPLANNTLVFASANWTSPTLYEVTYDVTDMDEVLSDIDITLSAVPDSRGNMSEVEQIADQFSIEMLNPAILILSANTYDVDNSFHGSGAFSMLLIYDEPMDTGLTPSVTFPVEDPLANALSENPNLSGWASATIYDMRYDVADIVENLEDIDVTISSAEDMVGNIQASILLEDYFDIHLDSALSVVELGGLPIASVFPNPLRVGQDLTVSFSEPVQDLDVMLIDATGRITENLNLGTVAETIRMDTGHLAEGMYYVHMASPQGRTLFKIAIHR